MSANGRITGQKSESIFNTEIAETCLAGRQEAPENAEKKFANF